MVVVVQLRTLPEKFDFSVQRRACVMTFSGKAVKPMCVRAQTPLSQLLIRLNRLKKERKAGERVKSGNY